jgi:hypothetical protein
MPFARLQVLLGPHGQNTDSAPASQGAEMMHCPGTVQGSTVHVTHVFELWLQASPVPHAGHTTMPPHPSSMMPHSPGPQVLGVQPQTPETPPPPQVSGGRQVPHWIVVPQPPGAEPQVTPSAEHVVGVQPQLPGVPPPPQVSGGKQSPQLSAVPQPSDTVPQFLPSPAHVFGVHGLSPHTFGPPPPQNCESGQTPHESVPPQPSGASPHICS